MKGRAAANACVAAAVAGAVAAAMAATPAAAPQGVSFRARRDVVRVDALVTDHGTAVRGLSPDDFEVRDNGVPQHVDFALSDETAVNAILALDMSGSVAGDRLDHLRKASQAFVGALRPDDRAALITFSHAVHLRSPLTKTLLSIIDALDAPGGAGGTSLIDASYAAVALGETDAGRSMAMIFSDGVDTSSWLDAAAVHDTARRAATVVYGVSAADQEPAFLRDLAAETGGSIFHESSTKNLESVFLNVLEEFRRRYLLSFSPADVPKGGWHRLEVRVKNHAGYVIKARPGYVTGDAEIKGKAQCPF